MKLKHAERAYFNGDRSSAVMTVICEASAARYIVSGADDIVGALRERGWVIDEAAAERFVRAYDVGIQHVDELLRNADAAWLRPNGVPDLATGSPDDGTRALLRLVLPDEPEPLTAPSWGRSTISRVWVLGWVRSDNTMADFEILRAEDAPADAEGSVSIEGEYGVCTAAAEEVDPRKALALALHAFAPRREET